MKKRRPMLTHEVCPTLLPLYLDTYGKPLKPFSPFSSTLQLDKGIWWIMRFHKPSSVYAILFITILTTFVSNINTVEAFTPIPSSQIGGVKFLQKLHGVRNTQLPLHRTVPPPTTFPSLYMTNEEEGPPASSALSIDPAVQQVSLILKRTSWFSWWAQVILTTVSSITLLFAKGVLNSSSSIGGGSLAKGVTPGTFFLAGSGKKISWFKR